MSNLSGMNGRDIGVHNLTLFNAWVTERQAAGDWAEYIRGDKLNRSEIAAECGFALSVLRQNPAIKNSLAELEERLKSQGVITAEPQDVEPTKADMAVDRRIIAAKSKAESRVKALEEQNAALRAEVLKLREQLAQYRHIDEYLATTGRMLPR
jgi:hypothetical protein